MRYKAFIPYVNRPDLLERAYKSVIKSWGDNIFIIDNSSQSDLSSHYSVKQLITPSYPLTFSQTMNFCQKIAIKEELDYFITMHNDGAMKGDDSSRLTEFIEKTITEEVKWGLIFTFYDIVCVYNTQAVNSFSPWDIVLPQYFADNDYFRRMRLAGWSTIESNIHPIHDASMTVRSDARLRFLGTKTTDMYRQYYISKWGGSPDHETFLHPFGQEEFPL